MKPFDLLWRHVNECDECSHAELGLCTVGDRLLTEAVDNTAKAMAPEPKEPAKA